MDFTQKSDVNESENICEDYLDVDKPIHGQNYCCLSFISPEKILEKKEVFLTKKFLEHLNIENIENIDSKYEDFISLNEENLTKEFSEREGGSTSVRGVKIRGVYDTRKEADIRAQVLQRMDRSHHVYVAQVGYWLPWDPNPDNVQESEYLENELNNLMKQYKSNEIQRDMFYAEQVRNYKDNSNKNTENTNLEEVVESV
tara:strand:+ start:123 stop:722 length:600 start_codon:yes stop_codon:yes gene_type:complete